jgi:hypothetical protein
MHRLASALKKRVARLIHREPPVTFTQSCQRCRTLHPSNYLRLVGKV